MTTFMPGDWAVCIDNTSFDTVLKLYFAYEVLAVSTLPSGQELISLFRYQLNPRPGGRHGGYRSHKFIKLDGIDTKYLRANRDLSTLDRNKL